MLLSEMIPIAMKKMKNYSIRGTPISVTDPNYVDLMNLMYDLANDAQMDLCKVSKISYVMKVTQNPVVNLLGDEGFKLVQHLPGDGKTYTAQSAQAFHFAVDRPCTLTFEQSTDNVTFTPLNGFYDVVGVNTAFSGSIAVTGNTSFVTRKGLLTLTAVTNYVRITPTSLYPFSSMDRALFKDPYAVSADVPDYSAYVPYVLPDKYMEFNKMMRKNDTRQYNENSDFKGPLKNENKKSVISLNWYLTGEFEIHIWVRPAKVDKDTDPSYEFEIEEDAQTLIPYYVAGFAADDRSIGSELLRQYDDFKAALRSPTSSTSDSVLNSLWSIQTSNKLF